MDTIFKNLESGLFDARYVAFLETVQRLRPRLHRYCARMTGSIMDGEDVAQEALFDAYRKLDSLEDGRSLEPWLFAIAHNRCIDFLRRRDTRSKHENDAALLDSAASGSNEIPVAITRPAMERLVIHLPPKERACILLKDVFDHSLEEIAALVDSSVGGVKSALSRARRKLATLPEHHARPSRLDDSSRELLQLYVDRFNHRDWEAVRSLTSADARLRVADCFSGRLVDSEYFIEYDQRAIIRWRMALGIVDGEPVLVILDLGPAVPEPWSLIRVRVAEGRVTQIDDYVKAPWILDAAEQVSPGD